MAVCEWWMDISALDSLIKPSCNSPAASNALLLATSLCERSRTADFLDEPLHGLDTYNRRRVKKIIEAFCRRRDKTMIMVTHYESELPATITDRLYLKRNR